ncbi:hypothetical protein Tcan_11238 [Toxocara canis]|uniref:Uncharacterized protein n=1 Tax=Toxocara canis TaxID=6265 RepID=A0A0B2V5J1_TOXCA|nr:hypothetical protein Tcan_11238 [Toxocara canis]
MQYTSTPHIKRSPYRLYRPYQLEIPESTFATNPTLLYRNPNFDILSEVNKRARRLERAVSYQKVLAIIQVLLSLLLLVLETTKILLIWEYILHWDQKFQLIWEVAQPLFFVTVGFISLCCVLRPSKGSSQLAIASIIASIAPLFMFPTQSPFVSNAIGAVQLGRMMDRSVWKDMTSAMIENEPSNRALRILQGHALLSFYNPYLKQDDTLLSLDHLLSLQYLLIAYSFFAFIYSILLIFSLASYFQLIQLQ